VLDLLASRSADLDARDARLNTLLMHYARHGKAEPIRWLLIHGADRSAVNRSGKTAADPT